VPPRTLGGVTPLELYAAQKIATVPDDLAERSCHRCSAKLRLVRV